MAMQGIKDEVRGREIELLRGLGVTWPQRGVQHIHCPFPHHDDKHPSWRWDQADGCFYCTCSQGSIIDAVIAMNGGSFTEASDWCRAQLGIERPRQHSAPAPNAASFRHSKFGPPSTWWIYRDARGAIAGAAARYETGKGKQVLPWTPDGNSWKAKAMPAPRPLYRLPELFHDKARPVLITEGEKAADRAAQLFPAYAVTTSVGGCKAWRQSDWSVLNGRRVVIWPDNDENGELYAKNVANRLVKEGASSVAVVEISNQWPDKWDLADELPPNFFHEDLEELVNAARPIVMSTGRPERSKIETLKAACDDSRPLVQVAAGRLAALADEAEHHLIADGVPFYRRGDLLVRPITDEVPTSNGTTIKMPRLRFVTDTFLQLTLCRHIRFERFDRRSNDWVPSNAPKELAGVINSRSGEWRFPPIAGIISAPTLRRDGTLLDKPGYDPATGLILIDPPELPDMPSNPTRDDALDALVLLKELLADFPFVDDTSRAVALSALITPVLRGMLATVPMHVTTAPQAGTGKSYLIDIASVIATGQLCPVMTAGKTEEELEKRIGAALMAGQPIVSIDNVNGDLAGSSLCQAIERPVVAVRVLGKSEMPLVQNRACFFGTGNNIRLVADLTRRALLCRLDSGEERPELRRFAGKPTETALADRGPYIAACLNIVRAYNAAGRPGSLQPLASFESWSDTVRSALVWLGEADPVESMEVAREVDPRREEITSFLHAFAEEIGTGPSFKRTTAQIIKAAEAKHIVFGDGGGMRELDEPANPRLKEAVESISPNGKPSARSIGKWLAGHTNAVYSQLKLRRLTDEKNGHKWFIDRI